MQRWKRSRGAALLTLVALAGLAASKGARAQNTDQPVDLGPLPRPVALLRMDRPLLTVLAQGDYGDVRITGTLDEAPPGNFKLTDTYGRSREVGWKEIRTLSLVEFAAEGFPAGSSRITLVSDPVPLAGTGTSGSATSGGYTSRALNPEQGGWRLLRLPAGSFTLHGDPYGSMTIPTSRVVSLQMEPIRGNVTDLPNGTIRIEPFGGTVVGVPLEQVQTLQRDVPRGAITVTLADNQALTGKLVEMPHVTLSLDTEGKKQSIPMEQVVQFERLTPGARRL
jgi:hypothetical protein